jgi:chromate transporter
VRFTPTGSAHSAALAVLIGHRLMGVTGAVVAVLGVLAGPTLMVVALAELYRRFADAVILNTFLAGAAAAAVRMLFSMGVNSASRIPLSRQETR